MRFYVGLAEPAHARHFARAFLSVNRLRRRRADFEAGAWIMDSGAFTEISTHGRYRAEVAGYAADVRRWRGCGTLVAAVAQDWMCEPWIVERTGLSVPEHQRLTVERLDALLDADPGAPGRARRREAMDRRGTSSPHFVRSARTLLHTLGRGCAGSSASSSHRIAWDTVDMITTPLHDPYLSDKEGARLFGISVSTFWRRVADGTIPPGVKVGGCRRWRLSQIEAVRQRLEEEGI